MLNKMLCWFVFLFVFIFVILYPANWSLQLTDEKIESERILCKSKLRYVYIRKRADPQLKTMALMTIVVFVLNVPLTIVYVVLFKAGWTLHDLTNKFEFPWFMAVAFIVLASFSRVMSPRLHGRCYRQGTMYLKEIVRETKTPAFNSSELLVSDGEHDLHCSFFALLKAKLKPGKKIDCLYATGGKSFRITKITDPSSATDSVFHDKEGHSGYHITGRVCDVDYALIRVFGFIISLYKIDTDILLSDYSVGDCVEIVIGGLSVPRT